jgi:hypothetical protein
MEQALALNATVSLLYDTLLEPAAWAPALQALAGLFESPMSAVWSYDFESRMPFGFQTFGFDTRATQVYAERFAGIDPSTAVVLAAPVGLWMGDERLLDPRAKHQQEYIREFALPYGIGRVGGPCR